MTSAPRSLLLPLLGLAALCVLALGACGSDEGAGNPDSELSTEQASAPLEDAPPQLVAIRDQANELLDGGTEAFDGRLAELRGTPVVVNKWASWCGPCRLEFPFFQSQADERGAEVAFLGVLSDDSEDAGATFLEELPLPYPSYIDPDQDIAAEIDAPQNFPATELLRLQGRARLHAPGRLRRRAGSSPRTSSATRARTPGSVAPQAEEWMSDNGSRGCRNRDRRVAVLLLLVELLLPTGGVLALIGAAGLVAAGIVSLSEDDDAADYVGPGLITLGVLSIATFFIITPKIIRAHRDEPVRTGWEELIGLDAEVRDALDPLGQVWIEGALWKARAADGDAPIAIGNRVRIESVDGLTLIVRPADSQGTTRKAS